jgi:cytosine/adenosine deaminase-related metal-dependent hydrolase
VFDPQQQRFWRADLAINHSHGTRLLAAPEPDGTIVDVGDLPGAGAKEVIDATDCLIMPGRQPELPGPLRVDELRGSIARGAAADLLIFDFAGNAEPIEVLDHRRLKRVLVAGATVWSDDDPVDAASAAIATCVEEAADA